jgi:small-conductance mechanosensitive channel
MSKKDIRRTILVILLSVAAFAILIFILYMMGSLESAIVNGVAALITWAVFWSILYGIAIIKALIRRSKIRKALKKYNARTLIKEMGKEDAKRHIAKIQVENEDKVYKKFGIIISMIVVLLFVFLIICLKMTRQ